jgi:hypothetical protein
MDLGDLRGGEEAIHRAFGVVKDEVKIESELVDVVKSLSYGSYKVMYDATLTGDVIGFSINVRKTSEADLAFIRECIDAIDQKILDYNRAKEQQLIDKRIEIIRTLSQEL